MATQWTNAQNEALTINGNLLVSASAGSGKTTVMIERALNYIKAGGDIRRLVILTFSKASAAEMKEKLLQSLYASLGEENSTHIKNQIAAMPFANISTIDSYCSYIFRTYFEDIGGDPQTEQLDPTEEAPRLLQSVTETVESLLISGDSAFLEIARDFTENRSLSKLVEHISSIINFIQVLSEPLTFLDTATAEAKASLNDSKSIKYLLAHYRKKVAKYHHEVEGILNRIHQLKDAGLSLPDAALDVLSYLLVFLDRISRSSDSQQFISTVHSWEAPKKISSKPTFDDVRQDIMDIAITVSESIKNFIKTDLFEKFGALSYSDICEMSNAAQKHNLKLLEITRLAYNNFQQGKKHDKVASFADIEHFALQILSNPARAKEVQSNIDAIFMDEYQDTNYLQEAIINAIQSDNLFMVGDVKQSIYRFRFAEPKLFLNRRDNYSMLGNGSNVNLNDNFRSNADVLNFVNLVFDKVLTMDFGRIDYARDARLVAGGNYPLDPAVPAVSIALFKKTPSEIIFPDKYTIEDAPLCSDPLSQEGVYIAETITDLVKNHTIYDKATDSQRPIQYKDIALLFHVKSAPTICEQFQNYNIPYLASSFKGNSVTEDIELLVSLLRVIDNSKQDIYLASAMLSFFGKFSDADLGTIRLASKSKFFHQAVDTFSGNPAIENKITSFYNIIRIYKSLASMQSVATLLDYIISSSGFDAFLAPIENGKRLQLVNIFINSIRDKASCYDIPAFLKYYDSQPQVDICLPTSSENVVTLMSIHSSKGLEFPIVFYANAHNGFSKGRITKKDLQLDADFGINFKYRNAIDKVSSNTITSNAFQQKHANEELQEYVRLMYVAFTRAKYHLFITGVETKKILSYPDDATSTVEWIKYASQHDPRIANLITRPEVTAKEATAPITPPTAQYFKELELNHAYCHQEATKINTKYSVSAISKMDSDDENIQYIGTLGDTNAELGILYHTILENLDVQMYSKVQIKEQIQNMIEKNIISCNLEDVDLDMLQNVLESEVFVLARKSKLHREVPFMLYLPASKLMETSCKDKILVQGIIDLVIEGDQNILVDYKNTKLTPESAALRYKSQINTYAIAVEQLMGLKLDRKILYLINQNTFVEM